MTIARCPAGLRFGRVSRRRNKVIQMRKSASIALAALFVCCGAVNNFTRPVELSSQTTTQSPAQSESEHLRKTIVDLYEHGKYDEALPLAKRVLELERGLGPERPEFAVALANLAELYFALKKDGEAENLFQQAAAIYEKNQITSAPVSNVLERLAQYSFSKRKYDRAIMLLERSLAIRERSFGAESSQVSETLQELATVYQVNHEYQRSELLYVRSITIKEKILGRTNPNTVNAMKDYACLRVKSKPLPVEKENVRTEQTDAERERKSVIERASCWLYGFKQDCDKESYERLDSSTVLNGKAIKLAQPPYPVAARSQHISGIVFVAVLIDEEGDVINAKPVCGGFSELNGAGVGAARASKFTPTKLNDRAVQVTGVIVYRFIAQ